MEWSKNGWDISRTVQAVLLLLVAMFWHHEFFARPKKKPKH
jgi:hypothetical protein